MSIEVDEVLKGADRTRAEWSIEVWFGDPVVADAAEQRSEAEVGDGPVGARVLIFGLEDGQGLLVWDGLIADDSGEARLSPVQPADDADGISGLDQTVEVVRSLT